jgi:branched-chain amino acid aminotransferase
MHPDIWMNGSFIPWDRAFIHPFAHSLQRGACLFESLDCNEAVNGLAAIFRLREHMERFERSADIIGMTIPYDRREMERAIIETVARSGMKKCAIRPLAFYTDPILDLLPGASPVAVAIGLGVFHPSAAELHVKIAGLRKIDNSSMPLKAKVSGNYISPLLAKADAVREGYHDAIFLDREGFIAEATTANVFIVENGRLITSTDDTILLGVTRDSIMQIAQALGIPFAREKFGPERLVAADEAILCSSGNELKPIVRVGDCVIGDGAQGPMITRLQTFYYDVIVGKVKEFEHWLTYVYAE